MVNTYPFLLIANRYNPLQRQFISPQQAVMNNGVDGKSYLPCIRANPEENNPSDILSENHDFFLYTFTVPSFISIA